MANLNDLTVPGQNAACDYQVATNKHMGFLTAITDAKVPTVTESTLARVDISASFEAGGTTDDGKARNDVQIDSANSGGIQTVIGVALYAGASGGVAQWVKAVASQALGIGDNVKFLVGQLTIDFTIGQE